MRKDSVYKDVKWIDLENPTSTEARKLIEEFSITPEVANELLSPTVRPRVDINDKFLYLILHFPISYSPNASDTETKKTQEIDFVIGKNFIITTHYDGIDALHDFSKVFEVQSILDKSDLGNHGGFVFFYMIQHFYKQMLNRIEKIRDLTNDIEQKIFHGEERQMVIEISKLNRVILTFKESLATHKEVLESFQIIGQKFFGEDFKYHLHTIVSEYYKVSSHLENVKEYLGELRQTNDSLLTTKQNEITKNLTVMAFVVLPLSLVATVFGMNAENLPIVGQENDFIKIIFIMITLTLAMFIFFRSKKWL